MDKSHLTWAALFLVVLAAAVAAYWLDAQQPTGGTGQRGIVKLTFGIAGAACLAFAALYWVRKRLPRWPLGSARFWMKGHFWLSGLSVPLILLHAGFDFGGPLTQCALVLLFAVVVTGCWGLLMQHALPRAMKTRIPSEIAHSQIANSCKLMTSQADDIVRGACGSILDNERTSVASTDHVKLRNFYRNHVRPFLAASASGRSPLVASHRAESLFNELQSDVEPALHGVVEQLISVCNQRRQVMLQVRLYRWLHAWRFLHVPLSIALLALVIVHVVTALS